MPFQHQKLLVTHGSSLETAPHGHLEATEQSVHHRFGHIRLIHSCQVALKLCIQLGQAPRHHRFETVIQPQLTGLTNGLRRPTRSHSSPGRRSSRPLNRSRSASSREAGRSNAFAPSRPSWGPRPLPHAAPRRSWPMQSELWSLEAPSASAPQHPPCPSKCILNACQRPEHTAIPQHFPAPCIQSGGLNTSTSRNQLT